MAKRFFSGWLLMVVAVQFVMGARALADAPLVYATIEPAQITLGQSAMYTITNLGDGSDSISPPVVSGLKFEVIGHRRQIEFINGNTVPSSQILVKVTPQIAGIFTIPALTPKSQPLVLQVNSGANGASSPKAAAAAPYRAPILTGAAMPKGIRLTEDGSAFVRLEVPKREVYVGENVPVEIQLGMRSGFVLKINGLPRLTGDDFTLNNLSTSPDRSEEILDGEPFVLLTWRSVLAVVKPGSFSFAAETPITVKIRTRPRRESILDDQFGDPFLQNIFGASVPKDINVASPPAELKVLALPTEGRPPDFHGAIGTFSIDTDISPTTADAGDPLTLRMHVTGSGNFDRVDSSMLDHVDQWKTYPPKSSFMTSDPTGRKGEKIFEQPLIALKPGVQSLPALSFSYFDPSAHRYETVRSAPLSVNISPSLADRSLTAPLKAGGTASAIDQGENGMRPDHAMGETFADSLTPLYLQPRFLAIPSFLALAFAGSWLAVRRRKDPNRKVSKSDRAALKAANRVLAGMEAAARGGDVALYFGLARSAMQQALAARWQMPPDQVTTAEVTDRVEGEGEKGEKIRQLFALADESQYSGNKLGSIDFARWTRVVREELLVRRIA
jgi:BatD DUF11 like domain